MPKATLDKETIRKNKAVNRRLLEQAGRYKRELAMLGWTRPQGYRLSHPLDSKLVRPGESGQSRAQTQT